MARVLSSQVETMVTLERQGVARRPPGGRGAEEQPSERSRGRLGASLVSLVSLVLSVPESTWDGGSHPQLTVVVAPLHLRARGSWLLAHAPWLALPAPVCARVRERD